MLNFIGARVKTISFLLFSGFIAGYSTDQIYSFIQKQALLKASQGLPSLSKMTNSLTCKEFDKGMKLVSCKKGSCKKRDGK